MPKWSPMFKVPFGVPRLVATCASLMASFASGPDRIGLAWDGALWPQAMPHVSVSSAERIANASVTIVVLRLVDLAVAKLWIQVDAQPVAEHVGREHQPR